MTTLSQSESAAVALPAARAVNRNAALDRARTFITMLVLIHHSVIAYTHFGHTDKQSFIGFDAIVLFNDSFFMAAMFLVSGLFVWPSLQRKGVQWFLRDRWLRLGLPYIVGVVLLMPIAYYAISLRLHPDLGFAAFWWKTVTIGPWESGPPWFVLVLFVLDIIAALAFATAPHCLDGLGRLSRVGFERPGVFFLALLGATIAVYVPAVLYFGASRWFAIGPVAVQASRVGLYFLYFAVGAGIGVIAFDKGVLAADGQLAKRWRLWLAATIASYLCIIGLIYLRRDGFMPDPEHPALWWRVLYALAFASYSAAQTLNVLALFVRFSNDGASVFDPLRESAYGIFLIHYIPVLWMQYALFGLDLTSSSRGDAILKSIIVLVVTLLTSWAATAALRQIPGAKRVL